MIQWIGENWALVLIVWAILAWKVFPPLFNAMFPPRIKITYTETEDKEMPEPVQEVKKKNTASSLIERWESTEEFLLQQVSDNEGEGTVEVNVIYLSQVLDYVAWLKDHQRYDFPLAELEKRVESLEQRMNMAKEFGRGP
jgi:hypothetical protein